MLGQAGIENKFMCNYAFTDHLIHHTYKPMLRNMFIYLEICCLLIFQADL